jgi:hypothetical protein
MDHWITGVTGRGCLKSHKKFINVMPSEVEAHVNFAELSSPFDCAQGEGKGLSVQAVYFFLENFLGR